MEQFSAKELIRGDLEDFSAGAVPVVHKTKGYAVWDLTAPPFLWPRGDGLTLCIPSVFCSSKGEALDDKIPLLRAEQKLQQAVLRLLKCFDVKANAVCSNLRAEQEYFLIDRQGYLLRPDLVFAGRTVVGAGFFQGVEGLDLSLHTARVLAYIRECEELALTLGIPLKTWRREEALAQHKIAPLCEKGSIAVDHNLLLMELMRQKAHSHDLAILFHEKPFASFKGSSKHMYWSLTTDTGLDLLAPDAHRLIFLTLFTSILRAVQKHGLLFLASASSAGNDHRLADQALIPSVFSVSLESGLEKTISDLIHEQAGERSWSHDEVNLIDRDRLPFFSFSGNEFVFRAMGAAGSCALPLAILNATVAESLHLILDEAESSLGDGSSPDLKAKSVQSVLQKILKEAHPMIFDRDFKETQLPKSYHAYAALLDKSAVQAFDGILSERQLHNYYELWIERYAKIVQGEAGLLMDLFRTKILPVCLAFQENWARSLHAVLETGGVPQPRLSDGLSVFSELINQAIAAIEAVDRVVHQTEDLGSDAKARVFCELVAAKMDKARALIDRLETMADDALWPLPKYRELLVF